MTYISGQLKEPLLLPNGQEVTSFAEVEAYLKSENLAFASDYSKEYMANRRQLNAFKQKQDLFDAFLTNYKRMIFK